MIYFNEASQLNSKNKKKLENENNNSSEDICLNNAESDLLKLSMSFESKNTDLNFLNNKALPIQFTSDCDPKTFQTIKNHFKSLFKVVYPESFFSDVYSKKYKSFIGLCKNTKQVICFSHLDIDMNNKSATILTLGVLKEYQNNKVGSRLLNKIVEELAMIGILTIDLMVQKINSAAIALYKKFDFEVEQTVENYYSLGVSGSEENVGFLMKRKPKNDSSSNWLFDFFGKVYGCF